MLYVISPAKNLDYESLATTDQFTYPDLLDHAQELVEVCEKLTPAELGSLMHISDKLAGLNAARFAEWHPDFTTQNAKQAMFAFNGDVYTGLDAASLTEQQVAYAQQHLRILSGLYGLLKPLDLMQAYRLEMGTKLTNPRGKNLYEFWGSIITDKVNDNLGRLNSECLVNLASTEYFKSVKKKNINATIITPSFKDWKNGQYKMISFFAKKARGLMVRYLIQNQVETVEELLKFDLDGYEYNEAMSTPTEPCFTRKVEA
jgi:hypothetical protein